MASTLTTARLVQIVKAYRTLGVKSRRQQRDNVAFARVRPTLLAQDGLYQELCDHGAPALAISLAAEQRELGRLRYATADGTVDAAALLLKASLATARKRIASFLDEMRATEQTAKRSMQATGMDVTTASLAELVAARRAATAVYLLPERPATEVLRKASCTVDMVDEELELRFWTGLRQALLQEHAELMGIGATRIAGREVSAERLEELADLTRGIDSRVSHYGDTTRHG